MHRAIIGLGTNLGDRLFQLKTAARLLEARFGALHCSSIYQSPAMLLKDSPDSWNIPFFNMAASFPTALPPREILKHLKAIEAEMGRQPRERWAPREIDLDLLALGDLRFQDEMLTVPHPGMLERGFVLVPLAEIAPEWMHPNGERAMALADRWQHTHPDELTRVAAWQD